jgi:hypothetical protein
VRIVSKGILILVFCIVGIVIIALTIGRTFVLNQLSNRLEEQIHRLRDAGYIVNYDSITVDWKKNSVEIFRLSVKNDLDTALCQKADFLSAKYIRAEGFSILPLILKRHLSFGTVVLDSPCMVINEKFIRKDSVTRKKKEFTIIVDHIRLPSVHFLVYDSKTCRTGSKVQANARIEDFELAFYEDRPTFVNIQSFSADSVGVVVPGEFYTINVREVTFNPALGIFDLDTLRIIPHHGKIKFGRQKGFETDRIEGLIPYVNFYGLKVGREDSLTVSAQKMTTQIFLSIFRDKRLPFKRKYKPLPIHALNTLPIGIKIDSLVLNESIVEYEEFPEDGADSSGAVFFDKMFATITNINNTNVGHEGKTELNAKADFMGQAVAKVHGSFPWNPAAKQRVWGTVEGLDMKKINRMLEPAIQVTAESGYLNRLNFQFTCTDEHSTGSIELDYKNLRLITYKNEKRIDRILKRKKRKGDTDQDEDKIRKASLKTFVLNTFIIRKNMDKDVPEEKRSGKIDFERDQAKSVFNFWWKSVLSGVKSAYNIEKIQDSKLTKLLKKKDKGAP